MKPEAALRLRAGPLRMRQALALALAALAACGRGGYSKRELGGGVYEIRNADGVFKYLSAGSAKDAGIGVRIGKGATGEITVQEVFAGSPAQGAGIQIGDQLLTLDGAPLKGLSPDDAAARIKGPPGSPLKLGLKRLDAGRVLVLSRGNDVMQFTDYPEGTAIRQIDKASIGGACPMEMDKACHFLIESGPVCFYSCPL